MQLKLLDISKKELASFFASPIAYIFLGSFLLINSFVFFWVETFFARNIADVRPLFEWMPVLLIFLVASLTMKMWSEEKRMGTYEFLLTKPISNFQLVLGKFLSCLLLVCIALLLTLPIPITVSMVGNLDWGPVIGGYLAAILLASCYISIGLTVSAKTENQIVSLIVTVMCCSLLYVIGTSQITTLFSPDMETVLKSIGVSARFSSITRGVLDVRDFYYYFSLVACFIALNVYLLERSRWANTSKTSHRNWLLATALLIGNFLLVNFWLTSYNQGRVDLTQNKIYSISKATQHHVNALKEPLLIRCYLSNKTHPLLAPLIPQLRDLILEYELVAKGNIKAEFVNPIDNTVLEEEAAQKYGIKPVPFEVIDKYQSSVVNSYFSILVQYGDQFEVLDFKDLIEVKSLNESHIDVKLRNPEYDLTKSIRKVFNAYQSSGNIFDNISTEIKFTGYISEEETLPEGLLLLRDGLLDQLKDLKNSSGGKFNYQLISPETQGKSFQEELGTRYGIQPMRLGIFDNNTFYFYMLLEQGDQIVQVGIPEDLEIENLQRSLKSAMKRFDPGFLKTVGLYIPEIDQQKSYLAQYGMGEAGKQFNMLIEKLSEQYFVNHIDLKNGMVEEEVDILLVVSPNELTGKQQFAIDQFLMQGGTVILATSPFETTISSGTMLASKIDSGLQGWLRHHGVTIEEKLVLDKRNTRLPIPMNRQIGGVTVQEIGLVKYPYFVEIREDGINDRLELTSSIPQLTMHWGSPIKVNAELNKAHKVINLLSSSDQAWVSDSTAIIPNYEKYQELGFVQPKELGKNLLGVLLEGHFSSYFKDKQNPLLQVDISQDDSETSESEQVDESVTTQGLNVGRLITKTTNPAKLIILSSNEFLADQSLKLSSVIGNDAYLNSLQLIENTIDWSLEDVSLLSIRSRSHFSKTLPTLEQDIQLFWEYINYIMAIIGLIIVFIIYRMIKGNTIRRQSKMLEV